MKLEVTILMTCACFFGSSALIAQELPESAKKLIQKLDQFEAEQLEIARKRIQEKRKEVMKALEFQMTAETRAQNLDGALAIRNKIDELKDPVSFAESKDDEENSPQQPSDGFAKWLGTVQFETSKDWILKVEGSEVLLAYPTNPEATHRRPVQIDAETRILTWPVLWQDPTSPEATLQIFENRQTGKLTTPEGNEQKVKVTPKAPPE